MYTLCYNDRKEMDYTKLFSYSLTKGRRIALSVPPIPFFFALSAAQCGVALRQPSVVYAQ